MSDERQDLQAFELAVLGAGITRADSWDLIDNKLSIEDFSVPTHAQFYTEIQRSDAEGWWGDATLIAQALVDAGYEDGYEVVAAGTAHAAPFGTLHEYVERLKGASRARRASRLGYSFFKEAEALNGDVEELTSLLARHEDDLHGLSDTATEVPWQPIGELLKQVEQGETRMAATVPTGFPDVDRILQGGFRPQQMVTIAGRPSKGKSTLAVDFARYASLHRDIPGLFVSLEMSANEIATRITAAEGAIALSSLLTGDLTEAEQGTVTDVRERLDEAPLYIVDAADDSWGTIRAAITSAHRRADIQYVVIDYLQLVTLEDKPQSMGREQEVSKLSRGLKMLAKRLGITVFAISQLNRGPENRPGGVPQMSDLRESGGIEQDSDIVALVNRPDDDDKLSERAGEGDLIIAKQRNGPTGTVALAFQGHYARFMSLAHDSDMTASSYPVT